MRTEVSGKHTSVCYLRSWTKYKDDKAQFLPKNIDVELCSVIDFAFMKVDLMTHTLIGRPGNKDDEMIKELLLLKKKKPSLKIFVSVGGWNHENVPRFHSMVKFVSRQETFINSMIAYLTTHKLDGVNLDWEYPGLRAGASRKDKRRFADFLGRMKNAFEEVAWKRKSKSRYFLTLAVSAARKKIHESYDIPEIAKHVDWINVMAYNLRSWRQGVTGCPTLTIGPPPTVVDSIDAWLDEGMPPSKINLGLASYGRTFELTDPRKHGLGAPINGPGHGGKYSREDSVLSYYEICLVPWTSKTLYYESGCGVPYSSVFDTWIAYEDPFSIRHKIKTLVNCRGLNGISFWALDFDDFSGNNCRQGRYPLLSAAVDEMKNGVNLNCKLRSIATTEGGTKNSIAEDNVGEEVLMEQFEVSKRWPEWWLVGEGVHGDTIVEETQPV